MARPLSHRALLRRPLGVALLLAVTLIHLGLGGELIEDRFGFGAGAQPMQRIEVSYVRELAMAPPTAGPRPAPARKAAKRPRRAAVARAPASAAQPEPEAVAPVVAAASPAVQAEPASAVAQAEPAQDASGAAAPQPNTSSVTTAAASDAAVTAAQPASAVSSAAAASAVTNRTAGFDWPPSTRLSYRLRGYYRGDVQGSASVEWIRVGLRYQVHMEAIIGPSFAPLMVRRVSSEGELGEGGLTPQRFEAEQRVAFRVKRWSMRFEPDRVRLPEGREAPATPGVQDEASLFVQLTWLFTTQPQLLQAGRSIEVPLALPRRVEPWQYDVIGEETLQMPFAEVPTVHVKPRRIAKPGSDLVAEMWFAPSLQYLPVRILIRQDTETFIDLTLLRAPQQEAAPR